jgi:hypothetical protein
MYSVLLENNASSPARSKLPDLEFSNQSHAETDCMNINWMYSSMIRPDEILWLD